MPRSMKRYCVLDLDERSMKIIEEIIKPRVISTWEVKENKLPPNSVIMRRTIILVEELLQENMRILEEKQSRKLSYSPL